MAQLTFKSGETKIVTYNYAAKIFQLQQGNIVKEDAETLAKLKKLAKQVTFIDFKKLQ